MRCLPSIHRRYYCPSATNPVHLLLLLFLSACLVLSIQAIVCPPELVREAANKERQEGEECGGMCNSFGSCTKGLVCDYNLLEEDEGVEASSAAATSSAFLRPSSRLGEVLKLTLGKAQVGRCIAMDEKVITRERESYSRDLLTRNEAVEEDGPGKEEALGGIDSSDSSCAGCPQEASATDPEVTQAAEAAIEILKQKDQEQTEGGGGVAHPSYFGGEGEYDEATAMLDHVVKATIQVVSGIRYRMIIAISIKHLPSSETSTTSTTDNTNPEGGGGEEKKILLYNIDIVSQPWLEPKYHLLSATKVEEEGGDGANGRR